MVKRQKIQSKVDLDHFSLENETMIYDPHEWLGTLNGEEIYHDEEIKEAFQKGLKKLCDECDGDIMEALACYDGDCRSNAFWWEYECDDESYYLMDRLIKRSLMKSDLEYNSLTYHQIVDLHKIVLGEYPWKKLITDIRNLVS